MAVSLLGEKQSLGVLGMAIKRHVKDGDQIVLASESEQSACNGDQVDCWEQAIAADALICQLARCRS